MLPLSTFQCLRRHVQSRKWALTRNRMCLPHWSWTYQCPELWDMSVFCLSFPVDGTFCYSTQSCLGQEQYQNLVLHMCFKERDTFELPTKTCIWCISVHSGKERSQLYFRVWDFYPNKFIIKLGRLSKHWQVSQRSTHVNILKKNSYF